MSWVTDLLKHLELSKVAAAALFFTSLAFLVAPSYLPIVIDGPPSEWRWAVWALCIFSGILLAIWSIGALWRLLRWVSRGLRNATVSFRLTPAEQKFLAFMGIQYPNGVLDLDNLQYLDTNKLETLEICRTLREKGLVNKTFMDENYVSLSSTGQREALALIRQLKAQG